MRMLYSDVINLLDTQTEMKAGFPVERKLSERTVYADAKSVRYAEFYSAQMAGMKADIVFSLRAADYKGEAAIRYPATEDGDRYKVIRRYQKDPDHLELTCERV